MFEKIKRLLQTPEQKFAEAVDLGDGNRISELIVTYQPSLMNKNIIAKYKPRALNGIYKKMAGAVLTIDGSNTDTVNNDIKFNIIKILYLFKIYDLPEPLKDVIRMYAVNDIESGGILDSIYLKNLFKYFRRKFIKTCVYQISHKLFWFLNDFSQKIIPVLN